MNEGGQIKKLIYYTNKKQTIKIDQTMKKIRPWDTRTKEGLLVFDLCAINSKPIRRGI